MNGLINVGPVDQAIRIVGGVALLSLIFIGPETWWGAVGLIPLSTGLSGYCPLYQALHFSTCGSPHRTLPV